MSLTIIGDVHGKYDKYYQIIEKHPFTIQLGDFGFKYDTLKNLDPNNHKIIGGNHDNYDKIKDVPHYLGDYGFTTVGGVSFFYYRGAYSIDRQHRTIGIDWWSNEENNIDTFLKARELYREVKPDVVLTHDCPESVSLYLLSPYAKIYQNITGWALQELFSIHQPKIWRFGHHHNSWNMTINGTDFRCLNELEIEDIDEIN